MFLLRPIRSVAIFIIFLCSFFQNTTPHAPTLPLATLVSLKRSPFPAPTFDQAQTFWLSLKTELAQAATAADSIVAPQVPFLTETDSLELDSWNTVFKFFGPHLQTIFGREGLMELMKATSPDLMRQRTQCMTDLMAQEEFYTELGNQLTHIKDGQIGLMQLWDSENKLHAALSGGYYGWLIPLHQSLNRNPQALTLGISVSWLKAMSYVLGMDLVQQAIFGGGVDLTVDPKLHGWSAISATARKIAGLLTINNPLWRRHMFGYSPEFKRALDATLMAQAKLDAQENIPLQANGERQKVSLNAPPVTITDMTAMLTRHWSLESSWENGAARLISTSFVAFLDYNTLNTFHAQYQSIHTTETATRYAHTQLVAIAHLFKAMLELAKLCEKNPLFAATAQAEALCTFSNPATRSEKLQKLMDLLASNTFARAETILYNRGKVLAAAKLLQDVREEIIPLITIIGRLDALYGIAHALKEAPAHAPLCIPTFVEQGPTLILEDAWNPCLDQDIAIVCNTISFTPHEGRVALLTGPNWSGKSTISRAIVYSILFSGLGVVPARTARMSTFAALRAYVNPVEDIKRGLSTYAAQVLRVQQMRASLSKLPADHYAFLIFDEPFKGTTHSVMEDMTCALIRELTNNPQQLGCVVTHIEKPTLMEPELGALMRNYFVEVVEENSDFIRTFRLKSGSAAWWFNDAQAQLRFRAWMSDQLMGHDWI